MENHTSNTPTIECTINMHGCNALTDMHLKALEVQQ